MATVDMEKIKEDVDKSQSTSIETIKVKPEDVEVIAHAKRRKTPVKRKFFNVLFGSDPELIFDEVIMPGLMSAASDILHGTIDRVFDVPSGGRSSRRRRSSASYGRSRTSYDAYYDDDDDDYYDRRRRKKKRHERSDEFTEITVRSRRERDRILERMGDYIEKYGVVTVAQVKYMADLTPVYSTDHNFGWSDMRSVDHYRDGSLEVITMDEPEELEE